MFDLLKESRRLGVLYAAMLVMACLTAADVLADHEADHRYTVEGFVLDEDEAPRSDVEVVVTADEGVLGRGVTDRRGFYRIELHLHTPDLGKSLTVKAGEQVADIEVTFDPADTETERIHDLNFVGAEVTQSDLGFRGFPTWAYVLVGIIILIVVAHTISKALKMRRKMRQKQEARQNKKIRKKGKKSGRKSRKRR
ncbi:MAG: hypothetical protein U5K33_05550 [Halofilum sp. (in: g-proteobacteria)]|nr:hypothetical protein [Halofilum sp. (in: g-proteobacteria)]